MWNDPGRTSTAPSHVYGGALTRATVDAEGARCAARAEYLRDDGGLFSGATQSLKETTLTYRTQGRRTDS